MQETEKEKKTDVMVTMETKMVTFGGILLVFFYWLLELAPRLNGLPMPESLFCRRRCSGVVFI